MPAEEIRQALIFLGSKLVCSSLDRLNIDKFATLLTCCEHYCSVDKGEESVVFTHTYVETGMVNCSTLTFEDVSCLAVGTTEDFHTESFAF